MLSLLLTLYIRGGQWQASCTKITSHPVIPGAGIHVLAMGVFCPPDRRRSGTGFCRFFWPHCTPVSVGPRYLKCLDLFLFPLPPSARPAAASRRARRANRPKTTCRIAARGVRSPAALAEPPCRPAAHSRRGRVAHTGPTRRWRSTAAQTPERAWRARRVRARDAIAPRRRA